MPDHPNLKPTTPHRSKLFRRPTPITAHPENAKLPSPQMTQVIDLHIHIMPHEMMKPGPMELITRGRTDFDQVEHFCPNPKDFLKYLDSIDTERAGLINYVAPEIIGFTPAVNDWVANFAKDDPFRLLAFGGVHRGTVPGAG